MPTLDKYPRICTSVQLYVVSDANIFLAIALDEPKKAEIVQLTTDVGARGDVCQDKSD